MMFVVTRNNSFREKAISSFLTNPMGETIARPTEV
jgi:hypothetical protein